MSFIGVDIGTSSVRSYLIDSDGHEFTATKDITRKTHSKHTSHITQSSDEIFNAVKDTIVRTISQAGVSHVNGISFTATCSMVVYEVVGDEYIPYPCDYDKKDNDQNIILWMDSRSIEQLKFLNENIDKSELDKVGGSFIPEMGLPKLKWLSDNKNESVELIAFELHDWITWMFRKNGQLDRESLESNYKKLSYGSFDGSFKGIDPKHIEALNISRVQIGSSENMDKVFPAGTPIGKIDSQLALQLGLAKNDTTVAVGCIDCYAGWLSTISNLVPNPIYMIAGTSTCFLFPVKLGAKKSESIGGVWGPYKVLPEVELYESGQPATGKLYECLFKEYETVIQKEVGSSVSNSQVFSWLEQETSSLCNEYGSLIHSIIKNYFYYGDQFGNRSPFNNPDMSTMVIDGPPYDGLPSLLDRDSKVSLTIRYNLILEFLSFQTLDLIESFSSSNLIESIVISGSQAQNDRFSKILKIVTDRRVFVCDKNDSCGVAKGAADLAAMASLNYTGKNAELREVFVGTDDYAENRPLLMRKQLLNKEMAEFQLKFRNIMDCT